MKKEIFKQLKEIDIQICMSGIYAAFDEEEANMLWKSQMREKAKEKDIDEEFVEEYIGKVFYDEVVDELID